MMFIYVFCIYTEILSVGNFFSTLFLTLDKMLKLWWLFEFMQVCREKYRIYTLYYVENIKECLDLSDDRKLILHRNNFISYRLMAISYSKIIIPFSFPWNILSLSYQNRIRTNRMNVVKGDYGMYNVMGFDVLQQKTENM